MCTKKLIKALGLIIVVALLAAALPLQAKAQGGLNPTYDLITRDHGTASLTAENSHSASTAVKMTTGAVENNSDVGMIRFNFTAGQLKIDDLTALSYWEYVDARASDLDVFIDMWLDFNSDGQITDADLAGYLQAEPIYTTGVAPLDTWTQVNAMTLKWSTYVGPDDPYNAPTIADFQANNAVAQRFTNNVDFGQLSILRIDIRVGYGYPTWNNFIGYADDVVINSFVEDFEPDVVWVDDNFTSETPGWGVTHFASIQNGINAASPGDTVNVAAGTYDGFQVVDKTGLTIIGAGSDQTIVAPTSLISTGTAHKYTPNMLASVFVNGSTGILLQGMTIKSTSATPGSGGADAIVFWNASTGEIKDSVIQGIYPINGVQSGQGIAVDAGSEETATLSLTNTSISGFQKNGIDIVNGNSATSGGGAITVNVTGGTITGAGPTDVIAQNGIMFWNRAGGNLNGAISGVTLTGFDYTLDGNEAIGFLNYGSGTGNLSLTNCNFSSNEVHVYDNENRLNIGDIVEGNDFDKAVTVKKPDNTLLPEIWSKIQDAIDAASAGDTILVSGTFVHTGTATLNKDITLTCATGAKIQVSGTGESFKLQAGASIEGCEIEKTDKTDQHNIITLEASGVAVKNNLIHGQWAIGDNEVSRAMVVYAGNNTGLEISGNEIWGLRQPAYISGTNTGTVSNNYVHGTKGWVIEGGNLTFSGNTFAGNVGDIAILPQVPAQYYTDILALSAANNNAVVEDQRVSPAVLSVVYVDDSAAAGGNGTEASPYQSIQAGINRVIAGGTVNVAAGTYTQEGALVVSTPNLTIKLSSGTVIQNSSPCFTVEADNVTIISETIGGGKCVPTDGSDGIVVNAGVQSLRIAGIEIDGTGQTTGDGIHFNGAITNFQIIDNYIHDLDSDGVEFTAQPAGTVMEIQGNLFQNNTGLGVNNSAGTANINAKYNSWGDIDGPAGTNGDGISANVDADPWTHVDLYMESTTHPLWPDKVAKHQQISYTVYGNFQNVMGADFVLNYPETLLACLNCSPTSGNPDPEGAFDNETITVDATAGTIHYVGYNTTTGAKSGTAVPLFTVTFEANVAGTGDLDLVETTDLFSMAPEVGSSNNIYAAALVDGSVTVIDIFDVTGIFSMQGRVFRGDIPVTLTSTDVNFPYGPWTENSQDVLGVNWSVSSLPAGGYLITTNQPRYLNITAALDKQFTLGTANYTLPALMLRGGNVNNDDEIGLADAGFIGGAYGTSGNPADIAADANFDGRVNILDLALVGGNYLMTTVTAYTSWVPLP